MDLNVIWFLLIGFLLIGYAVMDGFDLGAGIHQFFIKNENDKNTVLKSIAPFWDGNEVWLLTSGGALFAAFPHVYATVFSGFYLALILLLVALIFRALSIEFRNEVEDSTWRLFWDKAFSVSSLVAALLLGVALGNIYAGIPLDSEMNYTGSFFTLLRPLPLSIGLMGVFMISTQGAAFLTLKSSGPLQKTMRARTRTSWLLFLLFTVITIIVTAVVDFSKIAILFSNGFGYLAMILFVIGAGSLPFFLKAESAVMTFLASSLIILSTFLIVGATIFPNIVPALEPANSMSIYSSSSSQKTLSVMLVIALIGMPIVIAYTAFVHYIFRRKPAH